MGYQLSQSVHSCHKRSAFQIFIIFQQKITSETDCTHGHIMYLRHSWHFLFLATQGYYIQLNYWQTAEILHHHKQWFLQKLLQSHDIQYITYYENYKKHFKLTSGIVSFISCKLTQI